MRKKCCGTLRATCKGCGRGITAMRSLETGYCGMCHKHRRRVPHARVSHD